MFTDSNTQQTMNRDLFKIKNDKLLRITKGIPNTTQSVRIELTTDNEHRSFSMKK